MDVIATYGPTLLILAIVFGVFMTWGIGANDVANALGTSVGSGAITVRTAIIVAAIFEFAGAALAGGNVTKTIRKGIIDPSQIADRPEILVFGMLAALLAAGCWLAVASTKGWPVSTTHSIVGAIVGFAVAGIGVDAVNWGKISQIVASWVVSPALGGGIAFLLMLSIQHLIMNADKPFKAAIRWAPLYVFLVGFVISLVTLFKGLKHLKIELGIGESFILASIIGVIVAIIGKWAVSRVEFDEEVDKTSHIASVERVFAPMIIFTACAMAFAHGSNDVANGVGPLAAVYGLVQSGGEVTQKLAMPFWILALGGAGIVLGLATFGYRVMRTIGGKITSLTPTSGFCATVAAAVTVVLASRTAMPVSTTHIAVGAVMGVGLARGIAALNIRVIGNIIMSWVVTLPAGGILAALFFFMLKGMFTH
ncbi:MAG: phosphate permease [Rhodospirillaceae bacterium]|nr:phosphate permease [Rhodospirillaceae bacterium]|tara:strand:+ start:7975 stop:9243 length:1269 start_codon:yes stop_codon:yes gene_type:complete